MSGVRILFEIVAVLGVIHCIRLAVQSWPELPEKIPIHFGFTGKPDNWGRKAWIWLYPPFCAAMYALLTYASMHPEQAHYPVPLTPQNAARQYALTTLMLSVLKVETIWMMVYIQTKTIQITQGKANGLGAAFLIGILVVLFATTGGFLYLAHMFR